MRPPKSLYTLLLIGTVLPVSSADKKSNDRQIDGFSGLVKSVSTRLDKKAAEFREPYGPTVILTAGVVTGRIDQSEKGQSTGRSVMGPFGSVEDTVYSDGQLE